MNVESFCSWSACIGVANYIQQMESWMTVRDTTSSKWNPGWQSEIKCCMGAVLPNLVLGDKTQWTNQVCMWCNTGGCCSVWLCYASNSNFPAFVWVTMKCSTTKLLEDVHSTPLSWCSDFLYHSCKRYFCRGAVFRLVARIFRRGVTGVSNLHRRTRLGGSGGMLPREIFRN